MKLSMQDIRDSLERAKINIPGKDHMLLRLVDGSTNFIEFESAIVMGAFEELMIRIVVLESGIDAPTATDKFLLQLFMAHANYGA